MQQGVRVGQYYKATFKMQQGVPFTVTARIKGPDTGELWEPLALAEVATPAGHDRLFEGTYQPMSKGWYVISFDSDPDGLETMTKFYAYDIEGIVTGSSTTTLA